MIPDPYIAWFHQPRERFPRFVAVHSAKISGPELARVEELLEAGHATDDFTPIVFLDESLDTPEVRDRIQREAIHREPPREKV